MQARKFSWKVISWYQDSKERTSKLVTRLCWTWTYALALSIYDRPLSIVSFGSLKICLHLKTINKGDEFSLNNVVLNVDKIYDFSVHLNMH